MFGSWYVSRSWQNLTGSYRYWIRYKSEKVKMLFDKINNFQMPIFLHAENVWFLQLISILKWKNKKQKTRKKVNHSMVIHFQACFSLKRGESADK